MIPFKIAEGFPHGSGQREGGFSEKKSMDACLIFFLLVLQLIRIMIDFAFVIVFDTGSDSVKAGFA